MKADHDFTARILLRRGLVAAALLCVPLIGQAERVSRSAFDAFMDLSTGATKHTVGMSSSGVPLATRGVPGANQVGNMNFSHSAGAWPVASASTDVPSPITGKPLTATASQSFTKASTGAALGRFAAKVVTPLAVGVAIYDLAKELGWGLRKNPDGTTAFFEVFEHAQCNVGYGTSTYANDSNVSSSQFCIRSSAGSSTYAYGWSHTSGAYGWPGLSFPCGNYSCKAGFVETFLGYTQVAVYTEEIPKTEAEFAAKIASQSGWPSTSAIDRALADAMKSGLVDLQNSLDTENAAKISAPSSQVTSDPKVETLSDGTTKTTTTTCEWVQGIPPGPLEWRCWDNTTTVQPQKTTTETVVKTNPDGSTSTETITKTTPSTTTTGTTTAQASELDEKLCPDGSRRLVCSELEIPTSDAIPKTTKTLTYTAETVLSGGSCPADKFMTLGGTEVKVWNWVQACDYITSYVKPVLLAVAAFIALIIVMPGGGTVRGVD